MDKKTLSKILAVMLVITLTFANFIFLAVYAGKSYAASVDYESQETNINKTNISFDAYFISGTGEKSHTQVTEMNNDELKLFLSVSVTKGYMKDTVVSIQNSNFKVVTGEGLPDGVEAIDTENNTVTLKQINKGESKEIQLPIEVVKDEKFDLNNFSKDATVKLTGTFVNDSAKEIKFDKDIVVNLSLSENAEAYLSGEISKHVAFEEDGKKKELVQLIVSSNVVENLLPIKSTEIDVKVPTLYGLEPEYVSVISTSTKATNGNDGTAFGTDNYTYENGIITLKVLNQADEANTVSWTKNSTDKYVINLVYVVDEIEVQEAESVELDMASKLSLYNNQEKVVENQINQQIELPGKSKSVVSFAISNEISEIAKGYMLVKDAANTEYKQNIEVNIGYSPIVNNIEINKDAEYYSDEKEKQYTATTYYKKIEINKENLINILGEEGKVEIIREGQILATLNAENTSYLFEEETSEVSMLASTPKAEGTLVINTEKYIKAAEYDEKTISALNKMTTAILGKVEAVEETSLTEVALVEPTLQVKSSISNNKLSTVVENENVEIRVALQTNNNTNRLFENPVIEIELPEYIEEVKVNSVHLLYNTELIATKGTISTNEAGNKVIAVKLEGEQTKFNEVLSVDGMTLIIGTNLVVDKTAPSTTQEMKVKVTNDETEVVEASTDIEYSAPTGIITLNSISGYNSNNETVTSMSGSAEVGKLLINSEAKVATQTMTIINNYDYTCGNIKVLGRTPVAGNKEISTEKDLGSTFTAKVVSEMKTVEGIEDEKVTVYYSDNGDATEDVTLETNGWTTNLEEVEEVKSYLIVLEQTMVKGDKVSFSYDLEIPATLAREQSTFAMYKVYYTNMDGALQGVNEVAKATEVGLSTGEGAELEVKLSANVEENAKVSEGQIIEYTIQVKNIGKTQANNVQVLADIPSYSYYTEKFMDVDNEEYRTDREMTTFEKVIQTIEPGKTEEVKLLVKVGPKVVYKATDFISRDDYEKEEEYQQALLEIEKNIEKYNSTEVKMNAKAKVNEEGQEVIFTSNELINEKVDGYLELEIKCQVENHLPGDYQEYSLYINKLGLEDRNNVKVIFNIPKGLKYISSDNKGENVKEQVNGSEVIWTIQKLENNEIITFKVLNEVVQEDTEVTIQVVGTCDEYDGEIKSNADTFTLGTPKLEITHSSKNTVGYLTEGDEIEYKIEVKNISDVDAYNVRLVDYTSDGLMLKKVKYIVDGKEIEYTASGQETVVTEDILAHKELIVEITAKALDLKGDVQTEDVSNRFEITSSQTETISSSTITHTVNKKAYSLDDNNETITTYSISGLAWIDTNKNGIRELEEQILSEIPVILLKENGETVSSDMTGEKGSYVFSNVKPGNYIVAFLYDMANYDVTSYQIEEETKNNDAVIMNLNIDGIETKCAATNVINVSSNNINNIDLGLVVSPKFDLSLTKTISKVTVQTEKKTTTNTYNNSTLQKIEIPSDELNNATVVIEYLITVRNDGAIPGYAKRVVDYLSSTDLKFNSETNVDWYLGTDGNLYNSTLSNTLLQPGESQTLKLVLTKKVTEQNTGLTNNTAEIYEAFNDEGIEDFNSTPANKASNENDLGQADIIIGPKTGIVLYMGIVLIFMIILTAGVYIINKKVIKEI